MVEMFLGAAVLAASPYPVTLVGAAGGGGGTVSPFGDGALTAAGYTAGRVLFNMARLSVELGGREGLASADARSFGGIFAGVRLHPGGGLHARLGFGHHHELEQELALEAPVQAMLGSHPEIRHRTGAEAGLGFTLPLQDAWLEDRPGLDAELAVVVFPDDHGPRAYLFADVGVSLAVGRRREER
jgi:hypothetical protein